MDLQPETQPIADPPVRVLTIDDHEVFRRATRTLIEATSGFEQAGEASSGPEGLELAAQLRPDLVLVEMRMPGMDGVETARRMAEVVPSATIVLLSLDARANLPEDASAVLHMRKQDLSTRSLQELWSVHGGARLG
jgi:DNA-binding NarL/FixJ family response regulator